MVIFLIVCTTIFACCSAYFYHKYQQEKKLRVIEEIDRKGEEILRKEVEKKLDQLKEIQIPPKDLEFLEFTVDMYIKYAKDLNIYSKDQHEFIVNELERIRIQHLTRL